MLWNSVLFKPQNVSCIERYVLVHHSEFKFADPTCNNISKFRMVLNFDGEELG